MSLQHLLRAVVMLSSLTITACQHGSNTPAKTSVHSQPNVITAAISNDASYAISISAQKPANVWNLSANRLVYQWENNNRADEHITMAAISADSQFALTAERFNMALWNLTSGETTAYWTVEQRISAIDVSSGGHYALIGFEDGKMGYIDLYSGLAVRRFAHIGAVNTVAISPDTRYAISGSDDDTAVLWNLQTGARLFSWTHPGKVTLTIISPQNHYSLTASVDGSINLWNNETGKLIHQIPLKKSQVTSAQFSSSEKYIAIASIPQQLSVWDVATGKNVKTWELNHPSYWNPTIAIIRAVTFKGKDENTLLTEDSAGIAGQWHFQQPIQEKKK